MPPQKVYHDSTMTGTGLPYDPLSVTGAGSGFVTSFNTRIGAVILTSLDVTTALGYVPAGAITQVFNEVVSGSTNTFTLAAAPTVGTVRVYANGQRLTPTVDYTISGAVITTVDSWPSGSILADYNK